MVFSPGVDVLSSVAGGSALPVPDGEHVSGRGDLEQRGLEARIGNRKHLGNVCRFSSCRVSPKRIEKLVNLVEIEKRSQWCT